MLNVDELLNRAADHARNVLIGNPKAELLPTWLIQAKGKTTLVATPWEGEMQKEIVTLAMRGILKKENADSYSFMSEAWMAHESLDAPIGLMPRDREDKIEIVLINACDHQGAKVRTYEIKRDDKGVVTELELQTHGDEDEFSGRLYNLLAQ
jgi:hypothetical protein